MVNYKIVYRERGAASGPLPKIDAGFKNIRYLAEFLNSFVKNNPQFYVVFVYMTDANGLFDTRIHFLQAEYAAQRWLTGWKERLLANALEQGADIKWNHGLKTLSE